MNVNLPTSACDPGRLETYLRGDLNASDERAVEQHLSLCGQCREALARQAAEPEVWHEARALLRPSPFDAPGEGDDGEGASRTGGQPLAIQHVLDALAPTDDPQMLGRLGGYEVCGVIGAGGMGVVLKAIDKPLNRTVAIKVLAPHLASSGAARRRFAREAQAAAAVLHPNVVAIHSVSNEEALPYLVMPYLRGQSLEKRLAEEGPLALREILRIGVQIAAGLAAAHAQGLVHRDIKPANILLEEGIERVTITDFGLARAIDDATITKSGMIAGTPQYMSPEQARGEAVDPRSDLFSLGSVLYALCTGRPPFRAETAYGMLRRITDEEPTPIRQLNPDIPPWLCSIIGRLMAKEASDRFASAGEVAELLETCLAHVQQPSAVPLPQQLRAEDGSRETRWIRRPLPRLAAFAACALGLLLAGVVIVLELNKGTLTIRSEADDVALRITQGGELVEKLTVTRAGQSVRVAAGTYVVEIEGATDGIAVENGTVKLQRGGTEIVKIVQRAAAAGAETSRDGSSGGQSLEAAAQQFNAMSAEARRTLFDPPIGDLSVERLREGFAQSSILYRRNGKEQVADALENIARTGRLPEEAAGGLISSGAHGRDEHGRTVSRQIVPALVLPDNTVPAGSSLVVLTPLELIYRKNGPVSKDYGDLYDAEAAAVPQPVAPPGSDPAAAEPEPLPLRGGNLSDEELRFSEPKELVLAAGSLKFMLDFDSGQTMDMPARAGRPEEKLMDVLTDQVQPYHYPKELIGRGLLGKEVKASDWDASASHVRRALKVYKLWPLKQMDLGPEKHPTYFFRTRDGAWGILQLLEIVDEPKGIRLRYKTVGATEPAAPAPDAGPPRLLRQFPVDDPVATTAVAAGGQRIAVANGNPTLVLMANGTSRVKDNWRPKAEILDAETGKTIVSLKLSTDEEEAAIATTPRVSHFEVTALDFSPDGALLAVGTSIGQIKLFDATTGELVRSLNVDRSRVAATPESWKSLPQVMGSIRSLAFSPDCSLLAACGQSFADFADVFDGIERLGRKATDSGRLKVWETKTGDLKFDLAGHSHAYGVAFSKDGDMLASAGRWSDEGGDGTGVILWSPQSGEKLRTIAVEANGGTHAVAFSPTRKLLVIGSRNFDKENDTSTTTITAAYPLSGAIEWTRTINGYADPMFSSDGKSIAVLYGGESIQLWDAATGAVQHEIKAADLKAGGRWNDLAVAAGANVLAVGGSDAEKRGSVSVWSLDGAPQKAGEAGDGAKPASNQQVYEVAWGEAAGGLQAGIGFLGSDRRTFNAGDIIPLSVQLKNVSSEAIPIAFGASRLRHTRPEILDADGQRLRVAMPPAVRYVIPTVEQTLEPGEQITFGIIELRVNVDDPPPVNRPGIEAAPGKYTIRYTVPLIKPAKPLTGELTFEVQAAEQAGN